MDNLAYFIFLTELSNDLQYILTVFFWLAVFGFCLFGLFLCLIILNYTENRYNKEDKIKTKTLKKYMKICVIYCAIFGFLCLFIPSQKTLAAMYVLPRIANNVDIQHITNDNLKSLRLLSEKWLIELIQGNDKKEGKQ